MKMFTLFDGDFFGSKGYLANAVNTTKINNPRKKSKKQSLTLL
jgi:hypothetical protein